MRVLVLGGAGEMGRITVCEAVAFPFVTHVTVADLNFEKAKLAAWGAGGKATAVHCNVMDVEGLGQLVASHDVVLNTVGPFYRFGLSILNTVLGAGKHYADICDDWEAMLDMLELDPKAKSTGSLALLGMGASPGITNLLAKSISASFDQVDELFTGWSLDVQEEDLGNGHNKQTEMPNAATIHWLQQLTGTVRQLEGGLLRDVKPLQRRVIDYPGIGTLPVWNVGHPEGVTLPRVFPGLKTCANVMIGDDQDFQDLKSLTSLIDHHVMSLEQAARYLDESSVERLPTEDIKASTQPQLFAWAKGTHNGQNAIASAHLCALPQGGMGAATSIPLAMSLPFFARRLNGRSGVFTPEEFIAPEEFFDELSLRCLNSIDSGSPFIVRHFQYVG